MDVVGKELRSSGDFRASSQDAQHDPLWELGSEPTQKLDSFKPAPFQDTSPEKKIVTLVSPTKARSKGKGSVRGLQT